MKQFCVNVKTPEISEAIQKMAFNAGYYWDSNDNKKSQQVLHIKYPYLYFWSNGIIRRSDKIVERDKLTFPLISLDETIDSLSKRVWKFDNHIGEIIDGGKMFQVGCQKISYETIKEILEEMNRARNGE